MDNVPHAEEMEEVLADPEGWAKRMAARQKEARAANPIAPLPDGYFEARYLEEVGFGRRYRHPSWEKVFADQRAALRDYADHIKDRMREGRGLLIVGGLGRGKTHALALLALADYDVMRRPRAAYVLAPDLYDSLHRTDEESRARAEELREVRLLLLDDADRVYSGGEWALSRFDAFMEARHANMRATVVTVNDLGTLTAQPLLARTLDRWRETMEFIRTGAPSQRSALDNAAAIQEARGGR